MGCTSPFRLRGWPAIRPPLACPHVSATDAAVQPVTSRCCYPAPLQRGLSSPWEAASHVHHTRASCLDEWREKNSWTETRSKVFWRPTVYFALWGSLILGNGFDLFWPERWYVLINVWNSARHQSFIVLLLFPFFPPSVTKWSEGGYRPPFFWHRIVNARNNTPSFLLLTVFLFFVTCDLRGYNKVTLWGLWLDVFAFTDLSTDDFSKKKLNFLLQKNIFWSDRNCETNVLGFPIHNIWSMDKDCSCIPCGQFGGHWGTGNFLLLRTAPQCPATGPASNAVENLKSELFRHFSCRFSVECLG